MMPSEDGELARTDVETLLRLMFERHQRASLERLRDDDAIETDCEEVDGWEL
jgi:hypothetical protein